VAKKVGFTDKLKRAASGEVIEKKEFIKYVKAYKAKNGAWKFRTLVVEVTDDNRKEIYG